MNRREFCPGPFQDLMIDHTYNLVDAGHSLDASIAMIADAFNIHPAELRDWVEWAAARAINEVEVEGA